MYATPTLTPEMTGYATPDPLRQAFAGKTSAHSHGAMTPIPPKQWQATWQQLSQQPAPAEKRLAYIHIPFCRTKCSYCGFFQNTSKAEAIATYTDYLIKEISQGGSCARVQSQPIHAVYFGGGTPTDLSEEQISRIGQALHQHLPLANDCEITFESRFSGLTDSKISACIDAGFNRFSLGVQTFDSFIRRKMSRIDPQEVMLERLAKLTQTGQVAVVVDLIYGLPYQTPESWQKDLELLLETGIDGADLYQLIMMGNTRLAKQVAEGKMPSPATTAEKATLFQQGVEYLSQAHYKRLSVSHWAATTRERNIYNHYTKAGAEMIPFGCGAGGTVAGHKIMQQRLLPSYYQAIDRGEKPIMAMGGPHPLSPTLQAAGKGFDLGWLDLNNMKAQSGFDFSEHCAPLFSVWEEHGLITRRQQFMDLTLAGQFWNVNMLQGLTQYLQAMTGSQGSHHGHPHARHGQSHSAAGHPGSHPHTAKTSEKEQAA